MEIWKDIPWYEWLYQVSDKWNIKSLTRRWAWKERILKPFYDKDGYTAVSLSKKSVARRCRIHRLVLLTFIWDSDLVCNHKNWIKDDNRLQNLEYCTISYNTKHWYTKLWRIPPYLGKFWKNHNTSKAVKQYSLTNVLIREWDCISDTKREIWLNVSSRSACCKWKLKTTWWYKWKYK